MSNSNETLHDETKESRLIASIMQLVREQEKRILSERIKAGINRSKDSGKERTE